jgi:hypothetical protein
MRGTVLHLDPDRVVIDTDGGLVRELPAAYVAEHVEHAYSLTGHGMQGGTLQSAIVVASPRDLTAGWSYTALSRARETTRLLVYDNDLERERSEFAPTDHTPAATRHELLDRVARRMLEREFGDPGEAHAEREDLEHTITQATREHTVLRNELAERELRAPGAWVRATFGERPDRPGQCEAWENGVRHAARYRVQYEITDSADALGPRPEPRGGHQRDWERAREAIDRAERRLGREVSPTRDIDLGIGL